MSNIIYGIGKIGKEYVKKCVECHVEDLVCTDNNSKLWDTTIQGIKIVNPQIALNKEIDNKQAIYPNKMWFQKNKTQSLMEPQIFVPDVLVEKTVDDSILRTDKAMQTALNFKTQNKVKNQ